jgi:hypothetical protein
MTNSAIATAFATLLIATMPGTRDQSVHGVVTVVRLRVFAHAAVDASNLELSKATACTLLESARIGVDWRNCGTADWCAEPAEPGQVTVLLMPVSRLSREDVSAEVVHAAGVP